MTRIGFLGTGTMGGPMAARLAAADFEVTAWNRTLEKATGLPSVATAATASAAVGKAGVVVCMLSSGPVCDAVLLGPEGALAAMEPGATLVVMSSIPVGTARAQATACAARGIRYVDAPVSGGESGAKAGTLAIMAGGDAGDVAALDAVFARLGQPTHVGPVGSGQLAKLANQLIVASTICAVAEALLLAERGGADPGLVREALLGGFAELDRAAATRAAHGDERFRSGRPGEVPGQGHRRGARPRGRARSEPASRRGSRPALSEPCRAWRRRSRS